MKDYLVIRSSEIKDLEHKVNEALAKGYRLAGGILVAPVGFATFFQAVYLNDTIDSHK